jgi:hypothetical protein
LSTSTQGTMIAISTTTSTMAAIVIVLPFIA